jgi:hypothetical protein
MLPASPWVCRPQWIVLAVSVSRLHAIDESLRHQLVIDIAPESLFQLVSTGEKPRIDRIARDKVASVNEDTNEQCLYGDPFLAYFRDTGLLLMSPESCTQPCSSL